MKINEGTVNNVLGKNHRPDIYKWIKAR